jgi:hypothetical protein
MKRDPRQELVADAQADARSEIEMGLRDLAQMIADLRQACRIKNNDLTEGVLNVSRKTSIVLGAIAAARFLEHAEEYGR